MSGSILSSPWAQTLQQANFNGIPFEVRSTNLGTGRRIAVHEYPYRDNPLAEDLGMATRTLEFDGFLIGDDVYSQRDSLKALVEQGGPADLIHPSIGLIRATLTSASFGERAEQGRVVEIRLAFVAVDDSPLWPSINSDTQGAIGQATPDLDAAASADFAAALPSPVLDVAGASDALAGFADAALGPLTDAAGIAGAIAGIASYSVPDFWFGRYYAVPNQYALNPPLVIAASPVARVGLATTGMLTAATAAAALATNAFATAADAMATL